LVILSVKLLLDGYQMKIKTKQTLIIIVVVASFLLPLLLYVNQFGTSLSSKQSDWSNFGSFLSGIYSPLIALVALFILAIQLVIQRAASKHQFDQAFISCSREDMNFYITKLEKHLKESFEDDVSIKDYIDKHFRFLDTSALTGHDVIAKIKSFHNKHQYIIDIWLAIYPILKGLEINKAYPYEQNFEASKLRLASCISFGTCVAIDNMYYVITNDINNGKYYFTETKRETP
jgi:hypothetical protein